MNDAKWFASRFLAILFAVISLAGCSGAQRRDPYPFPPPNYPVIVIRDSVISHANYSVPSVVEAAYPIIP